MNGLSCAVLNDGAMQDARARWNNVAKPLRSLGLFEDMIEKIAGIQGTAEVSLSPRCVLVFCADHGVVAEGVTQSPSDVTAQVAQSIAEGDANVNLMASAAGADVFAVDMGMAKDVAHPNIIRRKIAHGTRNMAQGPAMSGSEAEQAISIGMELVGDMKARGYRVIATGEMGIGNTTSSAAILCALTGETPEDAAGRGAGLSDAGLLRKREAIRRALAVNAPHENDPLDILASVGGYEIAGMTGAFLGGAAHGVPVVIDGVISAVAALLAARICSEAKRFMLASHMSRESAARRVMQELGLSPVLYADMALGEGTGAVALLPLMDMALSVYNGGHTFDRIGVEAYVPQEGKP